MDPRFLCLAGSCCVPEGKELDGFAPRILRLFRRLDQTELQNLPPEVPLIEWFSQDRFVERLNRAQRELCWKQLKADIRALQLIPQPVYRILHDRPASLYTLKHQ